MGRRFVHPILRLLLIPAFLLAQFVCICASTAAMPKTATAVASHDCCEDDTTPAKPSHEKHKHDANCPHCTQDGRVANVSERVTVDAPALLPPMFPPLLPALLSDYLDDSSIRYLAFQRWVADPSPPPDLLRMKCTLQI